MKQIEQLEDIQPDPQNANEGTLRGAQLLGMSMDTFGAARAIVVDSKGVCLAGNKTLEQAVAQGLSVRVVQSDGKRLVVVQRMDLDAADPETRRLGYLDNRAAEMGLKWDPTQLAKDLAAGFQFNTMFSGEELAAALTVLDDGGGVPFTLGFTPEEHAVFERFAAQVEQQYAAHPQGDNLKDAISPARLAAWVADHLAMLAEEGLGPVQAVESKDGAA